MKLFDVIRHQKVHAKRDAEKLAEKVIQHLTIEIPGYFEFAGPRLAFINGRNHRGEGLTIVQPSKDEKKFKKQFKDVVHMWLLKTMSMCYLDGEPDDENDPDYDEKSFVISQFIMQISPGGAIYIEFYLNVTETDTCQTLQIVVEGDDTEISE